MKPYFLFLFIPLFSVLSCQKPAQNTSNNTVAVSFSKDLNVGDLDGRLLLMFAKNDKTEPRFQINDGLKSQLIFGLNVEAMSAGEQINFDNDVFGFPMPSLSDLKEGDYYVQALLNVYETFDLASGHTVKLPMDNGEGQQWNKSPGNIYSKPF